jgi:tetratricopeptide (TPR) repeat protein
MFKGSKYIIVVSALMLLYGQAVFAASAEKLTNKAYDYYEKGDYEKVIEYCNKALKEDSTYGSAWYWQAVALSSLSQSKQAMFAYNKVIENSESAGKSQILDSYHNLCLSYFNLGDYERAIVYGQGGISYFDYNSLDIDKDYGNQKDGIIHDYTGWAYYKSGEYAEAKNTFQEVVAMPDLYDWNSVSSCFIGLGWTNIELKQYSKAAENFTNALDKIDEEDIGTNWNAHTGIGWSRFYTGEFERALEAFNQALEYTGSDAVRTRIVTVAKAFTYLGIQDTITAFGLVGKAKEIDKTFNHYNTLQRMYYALGNKGKAWKLKGGSGYLGIKGIDYEQNGITGCQVVKVNENTPAKQAKILVGDVIFKINDKNITGFNDLGGTVVQIKPGTIAQFGVLREGIKRIMYVEISSYDIVFDSDKVIATMKAFSTPTSNSPHKIKLMGSYRALTEVTFHSGIVSNTAIDGEIQIQPFGNGSSKTYRIESKKFSRRDYSGEYATRVIDKGDKVQYAFVDDEILYIVPLETDIPVSEINDICKTMKSTLHNIYIQVPQSFTAKGIDNYSIQDFYFEAWRICANIYMSEPTKAYDLLSDYLWFLVNN